ncbi:MAG: sulfite exporter TauE/SafE family protein [Gammaproteobacteria bacterium]|nr:sulfite exporter TauE/SafE family protein [Gammaproteobacteria bacterium]
MITILSGIVVGLALGLTGGGGSILALPILVYALGVAPAQAAVISLASVSAMAFTGAIEAVYKKIAEWRTALLMSIGGMLAAPVGNVIAVHLSDEFILNGFAILMIIVAASMGLRVFKTPAAMSVLRVNFTQVSHLQGSFCQFDDKATLRLAAPCSVALFIAGIFTGLLSSIFGVGGGFLIVPALMYVTRMDIQRAVATSLLIITVIGISSVCVALIQGRELDLDITALFIGGGIFGMGVGRLLAARIPVLSLQKIFGLAVLLLGILSLLFNG